MTVTTLLIILLVLILIGGLPSMPYAANWNAGYYPSGAAGVILLILVILILLGRI